MFCESDVFRGKIYWVISCVLILIKINSFDIGR